MGLKKTIGALIGLLVGAWLLCPLPEVSILVGLVTGNATSRILGVPGYFKWIMTVVGVPIGWVVLHKTGLMNKIKKRIGLENKGLEYESP